MYLLDANALIEAKNRYYQFDLCPGFWEWLVAGKSNRQVRSLLTVLGELKVQQDALAQWVTDNASLFLGPTEESLNANSAVIRWVQANYEPVGFSAFANSTDMSLVSYAAAQGHRRDARAHGVPITETDQDS